MRERKQERAVQRRLQEGWSKTADLHRAHLDTLRSQDRLLQAQNKQQQALLALAALMGYRQQYVVVEKLALPAWRFHEHSPQQLFQQALSLRPQVAHHRLGINIAQRHYTTAWWDFSPTLQGKGGMTHTTQLLGEENTTDRLAWTVGATLTWSPYRGGKRYGNLRQSRSQLGKERLQLQWFIRQLWRQVHQQHHRLITLQRSVDIAQQAHATSKQLHAGMLRLYEAGQATILELSEAERDLAKAQIHVAQTDANLQRIQLSLAHTVGVLHAHALE